MHDETIETEAMIIQEALGCLFSKRLSSVQSWAKRNCFARAKEEMSAATRVIDTWEKHVW